MLSHIKLIYKRCFPLFHWFECLENWKKTERIGQGQTDPPLLEASQHCYSLGPLSIGTHRCSSVKKKKDLVLGKEGKQGLFTAIKYSSKKCPLLFFYMDNVMARSRFCVLGMFCLQHEYLKTACAYERMALSGEFVVCEQLNANRHTSKET